MEKCTIVLAGKQASAAGNGRDGGRPVVLRGTQLADGRILAEFDKAG